MIPGVPVEAQKVSGRLEANLQLYLRTPPLKFITLHMHLIKTKIILT